MRKIEVLDDVHIRFPARDDGFDLGVEIGAFAVLMAMGERSINRRVGAECLEQLRPLAERFHYAVAATAIGAEFDITVRPRSVGPQLRLVRA